MQEPECGVAGLGALRERGGAMAALLILIAGAAVPCWFAAVTTQNPKTQDIHIEA